jgi:DNA invertase Pin-like site-specific DNA recombinase
MKTADLYVRVSTDEQADKGYSQRGQEEVLRKFCDINQRIDIQRGRLRGPFGENLRAPAMVSAC